MLIFVHLGEVIGWAGRTWSHNCPYQTNPFLIQICSLILGKLQWHFSSEYQSNPFELLLSLLREYMLFLVV